MIRQLVGLIVFLSLFFLTGKKNTSSTLMPAKETIEEPLSISLSADEKTMALQLDSLFNEAHNKRNFNGVALVAKAGKILYHKYFGYADIFKKTDFNDSTAFELASVSKQFTAAGILLLKQQGKLNLDDDVSTFFPDFPYAGITVRLLLSHRSGLSNYMYFADDCCTNQQQEIGYNDVLRMLRINKPAPYLEPNKRYNYSNTNYALLAAIIEKVSGNSYADFMRNNIFKPAGMHNTFVRETAKKPVNAALGFASLRRPAEQNYLDGVVGDKGIYSTAPDMLLWDKALYSGTILTAATLEEAFENYNTTSRNPHKKYGFGWRINDLDPAAGKTVWHGGWWHGFNTYFGRRLNDKVCVVILSNISNKSFFPYRNSIYAILDKQVAGASDDAIASAEE